MLPVVVQQLGQLHPLLWAHPGAVFVVGNLEMQVSELIQLWDYVEEVVQHVTCRRMQQHSLLHAMLANAMLAYAIGYAIGNLQAGYDPQPHHWYRNPAR